VIILREQTYIKWHYSLHLLQHTLYPPAAGSGKANTSFFRACRKASTAVRRKVSIFTLPFKIAAVLLRVALQADL
jgi:hypothetical protein